MRELVVLGTASQVPTRQRNQNGYLLRWDADSILFDPGEGTQRQLTMAGVPVSAINRICITHLHGDHCLGLPGVVQRMSLDAVAHPIDVFFPASGAPYVNRLLTASVFLARADLRLRPVETAGVVDSGPSYQLLAERLNHEPETLGWRVEEPTGRTLVPQQLRAAGVSGAAVGRLLRDGVVTGSSGRVVRLDEVSVQRPGQVVAFVMDTGFCDGAFALAAGADLLVCEATFATADTELAARYRHLTAAQAARLAADSNVGQLVITHFSQRYPDVSILLDEARSIFPTTVAAHDLMRLPLPPRRRRPRSAQR